MRIEVLEEKDNPLLDRKEIVAKIVHDDSTPSRDDVRSKAIAKLKAKKDIFILDSIKTRFGARESIAHIRIYGSKDRVLEIESEHVLRKNSLISQEAEKKEEKGEAKEEPAKEEKAEEKPAKKEKPEAVEKEESKAEEKPKKKEKPAEAAEVKEPKAEEKPEKKKTAKAEESKESKETSGKEEKKAKEE